MHDRRDVTFRRLLSLLSLAAFFEYLVTNCRVSCGDYTLDETILKVREESVDPFKPADSWIYRDYRGDLIHSMAKQMSTAALNHIAVNFEAKLKCLMRHQVAFHLVDSYPSAIIRFCYEYCEAF